MSKIRKLVRSIVENKGAVAQEQFQDLMSEKAFEVLEAKKVYVAKNFFNLPKQD